MCEALRGERKCLSLLLKTYRANLPAMFSAFSSQNHLNAPNATSFHSYLPEGTIPRIISSSTPHNLLYCATCRNYLHSSHHYHVNAAIPNDSAQYHILMQQESSRLSGDNRHLFNAQYEICGSCRHAYHHDPQEWPQEHECKERSNHMSRIFCAVHGVRGMHVECDHSQSFTCDELTWTRMSHMLQLQRDNDDGGKLNVCPHRYCAIVWDHIVANGGAGWEKVRLGHGMMQQERFFDVSVLCEVQQRYDASQDAMQDVVQTLTTPSSIAGRKRKRSFLDKSASEHATQQSDATLSHIPYARTLASMSDRVNFILDVVELPELPAWFKDKIFSLISSDIPSNRLLGTTLLYEIIREAHHTLMNNEDYQHAFADLLVAIVNDPHQQVKHQMSTYCSLLVMFPCSNEQVIRNVMEPFFETFMEYVESIPTYYNSKKDQEDVYVTPTYAWVTLVLEYLCEEVDMLDDLGVPPDVEIDINTPDAAFGQYVNIGKQMLYRVCLRFIQFLEQDRHSIHFCNLFMEALVQLINMGYTKYEFERLKALAFHFLSKDDSSIAVGAVSESEGAPSFALLGFRLLTFLSSSYAQQTTKSFVDESVRMITEVEESADSTLPLSTPSARRLKGGLLALGIVSEHLSEQMTTHIEEYLHLIVIGLRHKDNQPVLNAACQCILQFIAHLHPHIMQYDSILVKMVCDELRVSHQHPECRASLCKVIENLAECSPDSLNKPEVAQLIVDMLPTLEHIVRERHNAREVINALAHLAYGANKVQATHITTYWSEDLFDTVVECARQKENLHLRCDALKCVSILLLTMPQERWALVPEIINLTYETQRIAMQKRDESLDIAYLLEVFGRLAMAVKKSLLPYLPQIMDHLIKYASKSDSISEDSRSVPDGEASDSAFVHMKYFVTRQRSAATWSARMIFFYLRDCKELVAYLSGWLNVTRHLVTHSLEDVRREAVTLFRRLCECEVLHDMFSDEVHGSTVEFLDSAISYVYADTDRSTVSAWLDGLKSLLKKTAGTRFASIFHADDMAVEFKTMVLQVLQKQLPCCAELASNTDDPLDAPHDSILGNTVSDFTAAVTNLPSQMFLDIFYPEVHTAFVRYLDHYSSDDNTLAAGTISEVFAIIKEKCAMFVTHDLIATLIAKTNHVDFFYLSRNCFFALGVIAYYAPQKMNANEAGMVMLRVASVLESDGVEDGLRDNALACLARFIVARRITPDAYLVPKQYKQLFMDSLPLKEDKDEIEIVYTAMDALFDDGQMWDKSEERRAELRDAFERRDSSVLSASEVDKWRARLAA